MHETLPKIFYQEKNLLLCNQSFSEANNVVTDVVSVSSIKATRNFGREYAFILICFISFFTLIKQKGYNKSKIF
jgi:hypothetical protein